MGFRLVEISVPLSSRYGSPPPARVDESFLPIRPESVAAGTRLRDPAAGHCVIHALDLFFLILNMKPTDSVLASFDPQTRFQRLGFAVTLLLPVSSLRSS